jgi:hypothetical protein
MVVLLIEVLVGEIKDAAKVGLKDSPNRIVQ